MRALILILILLVVGAIALVATGFVNIDQTRGAEAPNVGVNQNRVAVSGGQSPAFKVETGKIEVGTGERTIPVPEIRIAPGGAAAPAPVQPGQPQAQPQAQPQPQPQPRPAAPAANAPATTDSTQQ